MALIRTCFVNIRLRECVYKKLGGVLHIWGGGRVCVVWSNLGGGGDLVSGVVLSVGGGLGGGFHGGSVACW